MAIKPSQRFCLALLEFACNRSFHLEDSTLYVDKEDPIIRRHDGKSQWSRSFIRDWKINSAVEFCIRQLLTNSEYLPDDPFKSIVFGLRRKQYLKDIGKCLKSQGSQEVVPDRVDTDQLLSFAMFGESGIVGLKHMTKLVSNISIMRTRALVTALKETLGLLPTSVKSQGLVATFIEVISLTDCIQFKFIQPRCHKLEVTVEVMVRGPAFDTALTFYLRRIVEEAYNVEQSPVVMTANIKACMNENRGSNIQSINVKTIKSKRQQVLTILKSAVMDDGEIYLEMYLKVDRVLPSYGKQSALYSEVSTGFVHVIRRYRFAYCNDAGHMRCFSKFPIESLVAGLFLDVSDAKAYKSIFYDHIKRMKGRDKSSNTGGSYDESAAITDQLNSLVNRMCRQCMTWIAKGELTQAAAKMTELIVLLDPSPGLACGTCILQLCSFAPTCGRILALRDMLASVRAVVGLLVSAIQASPYNDPHFVDSSEAGEAQAEFIVLTGLYEAVEPALMEVRHVILGLLRDLDTCEVTSQSTSIITQLLTMFDPVIKSQPLAVSDPLKISPRGLVGVVGLLKLLDSPLQRLGSYLHMIEVSIGSDILMNLMEIDYLNDNTQSSPQSFDDAPTNITDLLGYMEAVVDQSPSWQQCNMSIILQSKISEYIRNNNNNATSRKQHQQSLSTRAHEKDHIIGIDYCVSRSTGDMWTGDSMTPNRLWNSNALLGTNSLDRLGCVTTLTGLVDEFNRYEVPKFMVSEGMLLRYLSERHVLRALHEAYFLAVTRPEIQSPYTNMTIHLQKFSCYYQLWNHVTDKDIGDAIFQSPRLDLIRSPPALHGAACILLPKPSDLPLADTSTASGGGNGNKINEDKDNSDNGRVALTGGCVMGPDRVLYALANPLEVFRLAWLLPPLFPCAPAARAGLRVSLFSGICLETAMEWTKCSLSAIQHANMSTAGLSNMQEEDLLNKKAATMSIMDDNDGTIHMEVVIKIYYEHVDAVEGARRVFAEEVLRCCSHMLQQSYWRLDRVTASDEDDSDSAAEDLSRLQQQQQQQQGKAKRKKARVGERSFVGSGWLRDESVRSKAKIHVAQCGSASLFAAARVVQAHCQPSLRDLLLILSQASAAGDGRPLSARAVDKKKNSRDNEDSDEGDEEDEYGHMEGSHYVNDDVVDPTARDEARLFADSEQSRSIQSRLVSDSTASVMCFRPCVIHFTMLALMPPSINLALGINKKKVSIASNSSRDSAHNNNNNNNNSSHNLLRLQRNPVVVGRDTTIARLVSNTLWLSADAGHIWQCASDSIAQCIHYEAERRWQAMNIASEGQQVVMAVQHATILCMLTQKFQYLPNLCRISFALSFSLSNIIQTVHMVKSVLSREDASSMHMSTLVHTITRDVCLRLRQVLTAAQCVHLTGGCSLILSKLAELENLFGLGCIPLSAASAPDKTDAMLPPPRLIAGVLVPGELALRKAISVPATVIEGINMFTDIMYLCEALCTALQQDALANIKDDIMSKLLNELPSMTHDSVAMDIVLGEDPAVEAMISWIQRSELLHHSMLEKHYGDGVESADYEQEAVSGAPTLHQVQSKSCLAKLREVLAAVNTGEEIMKSASGISNNIVNNSSMSKDIGDDSEADGQQRTRVMSVMIDDTQLPASTSRISLFSVAAGERGGGEQGGAQSLAGGGEAADDTKQLSRSQSRATVRRFSKASDSADSIAQSLASIASKMSRNRSKDLFPASSSRDHLDTELHDSSSTSSLKHVSALRSKVLANKKVLLGAQKFRMFKKYDDTDTKEDDNDDSNVVKIEPRNNGISQAARYHYVSTTVAAQDQTTNNKQLSEDGSTSLAPAHSALTIITTDEDNTCINNSNNISNTDSIARENNDKSLSAYIAAAVNAPAVPFSLIKDFQVPGRSMRAAVASGSMLTVLRTAHSIPPAPNGGRAAADSIDKTADSFSNNESFSSISFVNMSPTKAQAPIVQNDLDSADFTAFRNLKPKQYKRQQDS